MFRLQTLAGAFNGLEQKIRFIKHGYQKALVDPLARRFVEITAGRGTREEQARAIYNAVRSRLNYLPDPVGVELTKTPSVILAEMDTRGGSTSGDCDDHASLNYSLLQLAGIPAKLRVIWYGPGSNPKHIYAIAFLAGRWVPFDTTRKAGFATEAPYRQAMDF